MYIWQYHCVEECLIIKEHIFQHILVQSESVSESLRPYEGAHVSARLPSGLFISHTRKFSGCYNTVLCDVIFTPSALFLRNMTCANSHNFSNWIQFLSFFTRFGNDSSKDNVRQNEMKSNWCLAFHVAEAWQYETPKKSSHYINSLYAFSKCSTHASCVTRNGIEN